MDETREKYLLEMVHEDEEGKFETNRVRRKYNLRLAAHAPELLSACIKAFYALQEQPLAGKMCTTDQRRKQMDTIALLSSVIARASGGEITL